MSSGNTNSLLAVFLWLVNIMLINFIDLLLYYS